MVSVQNAIANQYDDRINLSIYGSIPASKPFNQTTLGPRYLDNSVHDGILRVGVENKYFRSIKGSVDTGVRRGTEKRKKLAETLHRIRRQARKDRELLESGVYDRIDWNLNASYPVLERWLRSQGMTVTVRP